MLNLFAIVTWNVLAIDTFGFDIARDIAPTLATDDVAVTIHWPAVRSVRASGIGTTQFSTGYQSMISLMFRQRNY